MEDVKKQPGSGFGILFQDVTRGRALRLVITGVLGAAAVVVLSIRLSEYRPPDHLRHGAALTFMNRRWEQLSRDPRYAKLTLSEYVYWSSAEVAYRDFASRRELNVTVPADQEYWKLDGSDWTADSVTLAVKIGGRDQQVVLKRPPARTER